MAKRFNLEKANQWIKEHGTNNYLWWMNPTYCDEVEIPVGMEAEKLLDEDYKERCKAAQPGDKVERYNTVKAMWAAQDKDKLREWASKHNHIVRMFDRDKAEAWMYRNPKRNLVFNNPLFFTYSEKPTDYTGDQPLEELLEEINRQDFNEWRQELRWRVDNTVNVNGVEISIFDSIADHRATVGEITLEDKIRIKLEDNPDWAEVIIRIELDGYSIKDYAAELGKDPSGIGKMLKRAKEYLKKIW